MFHIFSLISRLSGRAVYEQWNECRWGKERYHGNQNSKKEWLQMATFKPWFCYLPVKWGQITLAWKNCVRNKLDVKALSTRSVCTLTRSCASGRKCKVRKKGMQGKGKTPPLPSFPSLHFPQSQLWRLFCAFTSFLGSTVRTRVCNSNLKSLTAQGTILSILQ